MPSGMRATEEAEELRARLMEVEPGFTLARAIQRSPLARPEDRAHYEKGLRLAGVT